jgi:hypothetical protein
MNRFDGFIRK